MIVNYVKPSDDAAIAGTYKDLKFKNNLDAPVYIEGYCSGGIIYFNVYGTGTISIVYEDHYKYDKYQKGGFTYVHREL